MQVDWSKAPEWANWHAFDSNGHGYWYPSKPEMSSTCMVNTHKTIGAKRSGYENNLVHWTGSLAKRPPKQRPTKHHHYHKPTNGAETVDVYWVLSAWEVDCHAIGHAVKKLLNAGQRGVKTKEQDLREAIDSIERAIELLKVNDDQSTFN